MEPRTYVRGSTINVQILAHTDNFPREDCILIWAMGMAAAKILLVEDHADTLLTFTRLLERWGYVVVTAANAGAAIALCEHQRVDLLVCDIGLPDQPGTTVMKALRAAC